MTRQDPGQCLARVFAWFRLLSRKQECRLIGLAIARETTLRRSVVSAIISGVISRRQIIEEAVAAIETAGATIAVSNVSHLAKERRLLPEVHSLPAAQEHIEAIGMTCAVMAGEAVTADA